MMLLDTFITNIKMIINIHIFNAFYFKNNYPFAYLNSFVDLFVV